jgi:hypothetical protein
MLRRVLALFKGNISTYPTLKLIPHLKKGTAPKPTRGRNRKELYLHDIDKSKLDWICQNLEDRKGRRVSASEVVRSLIGCVDEHNMHWIKLR